jgi:hypothetical protein
MRGNAGSMDVLLRGEFNFCILLFARGNSAKPDLLRLIVAACFPHARRYRSYRMEKLKEALHDLLHPHHAQNTTPRESKQEEPNVQQSRSRPVSTSTTPRSSNAGEPIYKLSVGEALKEKVCMFGLFVSRIWTWEIFDSKKKKKNKRKR